MQEESQEPKSTYSRKACLVVKKDKQPKKIFV